MQVEISAGVNLYLKLSDVGATGPETCVTHYNFWFTVVLYNLLSVVYIDSNNRSLYPYFLLFSI